MKRMAIIALAMAVGTVASALDYGIWRGSAGWYRARNLRTSQVTDQYYPWAQVLACGSYRTVDAEGKPIEMSKEEIIAYLSAPYRVFEKNHWRQMTQEERDDYDAAQEAAREAAASPVYFENGIEVDRLVYRTLTHKWGIGSFMTDESNVVFYVEHMSPHISPQDRTNRQNAAKSSYLRELTTFTNNINKGQLQNRIANIEKWLMEHP